MSQLHYERLQASPEAPVGEVDPKIPFTRAAKSCGVTARTLERWLKKPELDFPRPERINGRRYFRMSQLQRWDDMRSKQSA